MSTVKVCYSNRDNMGDSINPYIFSNVFGITSQNTDYKHCKISGIGSGLRRFFVEPKVAYQKARIIIERQIYCDPIILWSAGFITTPTGREISTRKNMKVASVRGELSKYWVEKITGRVWDCTTGDGGLLASELINKQTNKQYSLGVIPHDSERGDKIWDNIVKRFPDSVIIDVRGNVIERLNQISQCECIVSSSLHGLIFADSFHIPNRRIVFTDRLTGDGFKFKDYYSSYGIEEPTPIEINRDEVDIVRIQAEYKITADDVEQKKREIKDAFWRYL